MEDPVYRSSGGGAINRRRVIRSFKLRGLTLQANALEAVMNVLARESQPEAVLQALVEQCKEHGRSVRIITKALLADIITEMTRNATDVNEEAIQLLNAFETPRLHYDSMRKQFKLMINEERSLFGKADDKVCLNCLSQISILWKF